MTKKVTEIEIKGEYTIAEIRFFPAYFTTGPFYHIIFTDGFWVVLGREPTVGVDAVIGKGLRINSLKIGYRYELTFKENSSLLKKLADDQTIRELVGIKQISENKVIHN
ncbi:MAG: hypothetical protein NTZ84_03025 [Candidatus Nealsonbacteria bacterium]|nr:hypothetical protein [Candidatus Nealsonbacteria bacterium]